MWLPLQDIRQFGAETQLGTFLLCLKNWAVEKMDQKLEVFLLIVFSPILVIALETSMEDCKFSSTTNLVLLLSFCFVLVTYLLFFVVHLSYLYFVTPWIYSQLLSLLLEEQGVARNFIFCFVVWVKERTLTVKGNKLSQI